MEEVVSRSVQEDLEKVFSFFPALSEEQKSQYAQLYPLYQDWNSKINLISRKDIDNLYIHHVLHSLAIAKVLKFEPGARVLDVGTGGGFPGIPLAVMFSPIHMTNAVPAVNVNIDTIIAQTVLTSLLMMP